MIALDLITLTEMGHAIAERMFKFTKGKEPKVLGFRVVVQVKENHWHHIHNMAMRERDYAMSQVLSSDWVNRDYFDYQGIRFQRMPHNWDYQS